MMMNHFAKSLARPSLAMLARNTRTISPVMILRNFSADVQKTFPSSVVVLEYAYGPQFFQKREPFHESHLFLAQEMIEQGQCIAGGPKAPHGDVGYDGAGSNEPDGAFFWFTTLEAAEEFLGKDPYAGAGLVTGYKIYDWNVAVSK